MQVLVVLAIINYRFTCLSGEISREVETTILTRTWGIRRNCWVLWLHTASRWWSCVLYLFGEWSFLWRMYNWWITLLSCSWRIFFYSLKKQNIPLKAISTLGINYCTASLGLETAAQMKEGEVVTVTGAAGGTGLAATELCLSRKHPVAPRDTLDCRQCVLCMGQSSSDIWKICWRHCTLRAMWWSSIQKPLPTFAASLRINTYGWYLHVSQGGSDVVFDTVGTDAIFNKNLLRSVRFGAHILLHSSISFT